MNRFSVQRVIKAFITPFSSRFLQGVLHLAIWSIFTKKILRCSMIGLAYWGSVHPLKQLGGTAMKGGASDARWLEMEAIRRGVTQRGDIRRRDTGRVTPRMMSKIVCTEVKIPVGSEKKHSAEEQESFVEECLLFFEYAAPIFGYLRSLYGLSATRYRASFSLVTDMISLATNSKSAQSFMFTGDGKYLLKTASEAELESMLGFLPLYAEHVSKHSSSLIPRFYGIYRVINPRTKRSTIFVVSSNIFSTKKLLHKRYDLKGSVVGRRALPAKECVAKPTTVLKDLDLVESSEKVQLAAGHKRLLMNTLKADAEFLLQLGLMDYSLLVGVHHPVGFKQGPLKLPFAALSVAAKSAWTAGCFVLGCNPGVVGQVGRTRQVGVYPGRHPGTFYYIGMIDVFQRFNLRKVLERGMKGVLHDLHDISAVPPEEYRDRFIDFVDRITE